MTNVIVRTTEDIIATLRPKQGIQCEENILYLFDPNVVVSITEATAREWLEQQSVAYLNEYIKPIMDAYEEEKEREIDDYVEEKQSTIFFDNTNFTGTTTAETINVSGDFSADNITTNTLTVLSSATIPAPTTDNNPATKKYVDDAVAGSTAGYHPDLLAHEWDDHIRDNVSWLRADTFSWQDGTAYEVAYQHLVDDIDGKTLQTETVEGITIQFYEADDTHKICPVSEETNILNLYNSTGVAWYYILDTVNQRFKLPRKNPTREELITLMRAKGNGKTLGLNDGTLTGIISPIAGSSSSYVTNMDITKYNTVQSIGVAASTAPSAHGALGLIQDSTKSGIVINPTDSDTVFAGSKYLYFYVGNFTQTAIENTAGIATEEFNNKADTNLLNTDNNVDFIIDSQEPTAENNYTGYELYRSGKIIQKGRATTNSSNPCKITLPVKMTDIYYNITTQGQTSTDGYSGAAWQVMPVSTATSPKSTTSFYAQASITGYNLFFYWEVSGKADLT